jgi:hypothetical protein
MGKVVLDVTISLDGVMAVKDQYPLDFSHSRIIFCFFTRLQTHHTEMLLF